VRERDRKRERERERERERKIDREREIITMRLWRELFKALIKFYPLESILKPQIGVQIGVENICSKPSSCDPM